MKYQYRRTASLALVLMSPMAFAVTPIAYDGWTVTNGTIDTTASCSSPGVVSCTSLATDPGMIYEEVATDTNGRFLRLILTDENATTPGGIPGSTSLDFASETIVPFAETGDPLPQGSFNYYQGIAAKQVIRDAPSNFVSTAEVQRGSMRDIGSVTPDDSFSINLNQQITGTDFNSSFAHKNFTAWCQGGGCTQIDSDQIIGRITDIEQTSDVGGPQSPGSEQKFVQRSRDGLSGYTGSFPSFWGISGRITNAGSMHVSAGADTPGTPVLWNNTNDITTTWVVQDSHTTPGTVANFQRVTNNDTLATDTMFEFDMPVGTQADPFAWEANFGTAPSFAVP